VCDAASTGSASVSRSHTGASSGSHTGCGCGDHHDAHGGHHHDAHPAPPPQAWHRGAVKNIRGVLRHTTQEFIDSAALIVLGAFLSAAIQMFVPRAIMFPVSSGIVSSVGAMMGFTWLISLCSNADAFVAKSFTGLFTTGSIVIFMTFGQMVDLKNTIVLLGFFRKRFVITIIGVIALLSLLCGVAINLFGGLS